MQLIAIHKVATLADWKQGDDVIITGALSDEEAKAVFPDVMLDLPEKLTQLLLKAAH